MKHTHKETLVILGWTIFSMIFGLFLYGLVPQQELEGFSQVELLLAILVMVGVGAVFWYLILKLKKKNIVTLTYSFGMGLLFSSVVDALNIFTNAIMARLIVLVGMFAGYYWFIRFMQMSAWKDIQWKLQLNNFIMLVAMSFVAIQIGKSLKPSIAVLLFFVVAIYDALAVWKLGTMQDMARKFLDNFVIPGIAYAKKRKNTFAILGGGDIFFLLLVPAALASISTRLAIGSALGMFLAIVVLFYISQKKVFYPALPFMFVGLLGALVAYALQLFLF